MKNAIALCLAACSQPPALAPQSPQSPPSAGAGLRIARHAELVSRSAKVESIELPFGQGQNGNQLVHALLDRAEAAGASYVGDLTLHLVFRLHGTTIECESKIVFADDQPVGAPAPAPAVAPAADDYATDVQSFAPHEVSFTTTERDLACKPVEVKVEVAKPRYANRFDAAIHKEIDAVPIDVEMESRTIDACELAKVTRAVTRYDYQVKLGFVPPDWRGLGMRYAGEPLTEATPECFAVAATSLGAQPVHRLTATIGARGQIHQLEPVVAPSAGARDVESPSRNYGFDEPGAANKAGRPR